MDEGQDVAVVDGEESDPFEDFNRAMGAAGDASPYPMLGELRAAGADPRRHARPGSRRAGSPTTRCSPRTPTTRCAPCSATPRPTAPPTTPRSWVRCSAARSSRWIRPTTRAYRSILQQAFTKVAMQRWEAELVRPLVDRTIDGFIDDGGTDLVRNLLFGFPVHVIAELLGLPEENLPEFHRLAVQVIGVTVDMDRATVASGAAARDAGADPGRATGRAARGHDLAAGHRRAGRPAADRRGDLLVLPTAAARRGRDHVPVVVEPAATGC